MSGRSDRSGSAEAERRREELRQLLQQRAATRHHPVSLEQERIWIGHQLDPEDPSHNVRTALELRGEIDRALLRESVQRLLERHEVLRSRFPTRDERPVTDVVPQLELEPEILELPVGAEPDDEEVVSNRLAAAASRPFDLENGPLVRWALLELGSDRLVVLLVVHHIVCDAWSMDLLVSELLELLSTGANATLPPLEATYSDFVAAERRRLRDSALRTREAFWKRSLDGLEPTSILPPGKSPSEPLRRRTGRSARTSRRLTFDLAADPTGRLVALTRHRGVTLHMILVAAFAALLHRVTEAPELVVATPVANRSEERWERLVGYFVHLVPLRLDFAGTTDWAALLGLVRRQALAAHEHRDLPIHRIAEVAGVRQEALLEILVQHGGGSTELPRVDGSAVRTLSIDVGASRTGLAVATHLSAGCLAGTLEYDTAALDASTAAQLVDDFTSVLEQIGHDDGLALRDLAVETRWRRPSGRQSDRAESKRPPEPPGAGSVKKTDPVEAELGEIWRHVLSLEEVSPFDNFLDVGGDSLAALQIIEQVEKRLGVRLAPADLFTQTLAQLATLCRRRRD